MQNFDIEKAKSGAPIITRDGRDARIICFDFKNGDYPIIALVKCMDDVDEEELEEYTATGMFYQDTDDSDLDLFMKPIKKTYWANVYKDYVGRLYSGSLYSTLEEAVKYGLEFPHGYIKTISFEMEE